MEVKELKEKTTEELKKMLGVEREVLRDLNFSVSQGQLKKVRSVRVAKKTIAKILTVLRERI